MSQVDPFVNISKLIKYRTIRIVFVDMK